MVPSPPKMRTASRTLGSAGTPSTKLVRSAWKGFRSSGEVPIPRMAAARMSRKGNRKIEKGELLRAGSDGYLLHFSPNSNAKCYGPCEQGALSPVLPHFFLHTSVTLHRIPFDFSRC